jgi:hypothetical protein
MTGYKSKKAAAQAKTIDQVNWADHEPNGLVHKAQVDYEKLAALGWQAIECPFCGSSGAQAFPKPVVQPAQEPVAWITPDGRGFRIRFSPPTNEVPLGWDALYTTPPQEQQSCDKRPWVGLTEEEQSGLVLKYGDTPVALCLETERKLKEMNT